MKRSRLAAAAALSMAILLNGCSTGYSSMEVPAGSKERIERETPSVQTSRKETLVTRAAAESYQPADETVYVTGDRVNLRRQGSSDSPVIGRVNKGTEMKRTGTGSQWSRVEYQGQVCYISSQYLSGDKPAETASQENKNQTAGQNQGTISEVRLNSDWQYAGFSKINSGAAMLYKAETNRKDLVVCVNAGHGTKGGGSVKTQCHPDGTPKVTGGTTQAGATTAVAVSSGMEFADGTPESKVTLQLALKLKEKLLAAGYDVLMIRESDDVQLDNIARTVIANQTADCHIALHWDSTSKDKGAFYMSVPNVASYRNMEPVKSHWQQHNALGESLISGLKSAGVKIFSSGSMEMDLTQTSFSTIPSIDIELGDKASDHSGETLDNLALGLVSGVNQFFAQKTDS
ncbi:MAG: N-acetylmuramoyl-L-alanine amidase [Lachnospiraceae bacterium]|jgi:N-acetylmuramoyl-L-alanine amidase